MIKNHIAAFSKLLIEMCLKSLIGVAVLVFANCLDFDSITNSSNFYNYLAIIKDYGDLKSCNKSTCDLPCRGAGPPPRCPEQVPYCISGCACLLNCENTTTICYETKHCLNQRQFLTGKKKNKKTTS
nr:uncharacterized protein LOC128672403 [Plodia interpunctella]